MGNLTTRVIEQFKFDYAVIGCSALDTDGDLLDFDFQEITVSQTIIAQARSTFLVADHSKIQRHAPVRISSLSKIDRFYTDLPPPQPLQHLCRGGTPILRYVLSGARLQSPWRNRLTPHSHRLPVRLKTVT